jgi:hypothetical protein
MLLMSVLCAGLAFSGGPDPVGVTPPDSIRRAALADSGTTDLQRNFIPFLPGTGRLTGVVSDARTGKGLPNMSVRVPGKEFQGTTLFDGYYVIFNLPPGAYSVRATGLGFSGATRKGVRIVPDSATRQDFKLKPAIP